MFAILLKITESALDYARILADFATLKQPRHDLSIGDGRETKDLEKNCCSFVDNMQLEHIAESVYMVDLGPAMDPTDQNLEQVEDSSGLDIVTPFGQPEVVVVTTQDELACRAITISEDFVQTFNKATQRQDETDKKKAALHVAEIKRHRLAKRLHLEDQAKTQRSVKDGEAEEDGLLRSSNLEKRLRNLEKKISSLEVDIKIGNVNIDISKNRMFSMLEDTFRSAGLLQEFDLETIDNEVEAELDDKEPDSDEELSSLPEPDISEEERLRIESRNAYLQARSFQMMVEAHFDMMKVADRENLEAYLRAAAQGEDERTRSEYDVQALYQNMHLTRDLIEAEQAMYEAEERAREAGVFATGWCADADTDVCDEGNRSAVSGAILPTVLEPDQTDLREFGPPMTDSERAGIGSWLDMLDQTANPEDVEVPSDNLIDDEYLTEPLIPDSISMVDYSPIGEQIGQWLAICEERRQQWRDEYPLGGLEEKYSHGLKRAWSM